MEPLLPETLDRFFESFEANLIPLYHHQALRSGNSHDFEDGDDPKEFDWNCQTLNDILHAVLSKEFRNQLRSVDSKMISIFLARELEQNRLIEINYRIPEDKFEYCLAAIGVYPDVFTIIYRPDGTLETSKSCPQKIADHLGEVAGGFRTEPIFGKTVRGEIVFTLTSWHRRPITCETIERYLAN